MKKHTKKLLGFLSFGAVVATTAVAVALPNNPEALATSGDVDPVQDTIQVKVVGTAVDATITQPTDKTISINPNQTIAFDYANAEKVTAGLEYTDINGFKHHYDIVTLSPNYQPGSYTDTLNLDSYGYGHYKLIVESIGFGGASDTDSVAFKYLPVFGTAGQVGDTTNVKVDLNYDTSEGSPVAKVRLDIYQFGIHTGKVIWVNYPDTTVNIDFSKMLTGDYTITATAIGTNGLPLFAPYPMEFRYQSPRSVVPVPNTGGMFNDSNISQTDYLVTGLIIFGIVAIAGTVFIMRNDKKTGRKNKTNRRK